MNVVKVVMQCYACMFRNHRSSLPVQSCTKNNIVCMLFPLLLFIYYTAHNVLACSCMQCVHSTSAGMSGGSDMILHACWQNAWSELLYMCIHMPVLLSQMSHYILPLTHIIMYIHVYTVCIVLCYRNNCYVCLCNIIMCTYLATNHIYTMDK